MVRHNLEMILITGCSSASLEVGQMIAMHLAKGHQMAVIESIGPGPNITAIEAQFKAEPGSWRVPKPAPTWSRKARWGWK